MNPRKYLRRLTIFSASGLAGSVVNVVILWGLTQFGLWYIYSEIIGLIVGGLVHYNLNVASGNIRIAGKVLIGPVCQHPGCTGAAEIECECGQLLCPDHHTNHE